jgi:nucleoside 2-deoxyribosyltransferase
MKIYLAGYIHGKNIDKCSEWRVKLRDFYIRKVWDITWLDPLNGKNFAEITEDGLKSSVPYSAIFDRDLSSVRNSDLIIANMNTFGSSRPPIGTISELAWAGLMQKPIVMITDELNYIEHPFMKKMVSWVVPDVETLIEKKIVNYFFKGLNTAAY